LASIILAAEKSNSDSAKQLDTFKAKNQKLQKQLDTTQATEKDAKAQLDKQAKKYAQLNSEHTDLQATLDENSNNFKSQEAILTKLKGEHAGLIKTYKSLKQKHTDSDKDGLSDADDKCPNSPKGAKVSATGCEPDGDEDGLADARDLCPETPKGEKIDAMGCHPKANIALEGVYFRIGTARLTQDSSTVLDRVVTVLKKFSDLQLEVAGHTDNTGSQNTNTQLSTARAEAVRAYLIEKGIAEERLATKGYGAAEPLDSNDTPKGRRTNRRVELRRR
jgi:outer membrane protein OmpA-like peptidoglycan-associated protein